MSASFLSQFFQVLDALALPPEEYLQRYPRKEKRALHFGQGNGPAPGEEPMHMVISGGSSLVRKNLLRSFIGNRCRQGDALVVLQPAGTPPLALGAALGGRLCPWEGSYDPLQGRSDEEKRHLLLRAAETDGMERGELFSPLTDEIAYLSRRDGDVTMASFLSADSRDLGAEAFQRGMDRVAQSHSLPGSLRLDSLRETMVYGCCFGTGGRSIYASVRPGQALLVQLPEGNAPWVGAVFAELEALCREKLSHLLVVFADLYIPDTCRTTMASLTCGQCFCYADFPAQRWLWDLGMAANDSGLFLRHTGKSAEAVSAHFHQVKQTQIAHGVNESDARCDTGGFMGLFGSNTVSRTVTVTASQQWEARFSADQIARLTDEEGIFTYKNWTGICSVTSALGLMQCAKLERSV